MLKLNTSQKEIFALIHTSVAFRQAGKHLQVPAGK
jgi:hypothetical protein